MPHTSALRAAEKVLPWPRRLYCQSANHLHGEDKTKHLHLLPACWHSLRQVCLRSTVSCCCRRLKTNGSGVWYGKAVRGSAERAAELVLRHSLTVGPLYQ